MTIMTAILAFIVAISILVAVHEFGHFWVARKLGVKVLTFCIGWGKPIWSYYGKDGVQYGIAALPIGGYVKMLGDVEGDKVPEGEAHMAFNNQPVWKRMLIAVAGPVANFIFAIAAYWLLFTVGDAGLKPVIGEVLPNTPAAEAGIVPNEHFLRVDGYLTPTWQTAGLRLMKASVDRESIEIELDGPLGQRRLAVDFSSLGGEPDVMLRQLGVVPWRAEYEAVIGGVQEGSPAAAAGLQEGDRVLRANDTEIADWNTWLQLVRAHPGKALQLRLLRNGNELSLLLVPRSRMEGEHEIGQAGVWPQITPAGQAELAAHEAVDQRGPWDALTGGMARTWDMSIMTLKLLGRMVTGQVSVRHIGGPIQIADYAGRSASIGFTAFLSFLAVISISLGVLNLLPIPLLDGGHLLYYAVEIIKGRPLSAEAQQVGQMIGIAAVITLMSVAFYNDILRVLS